MDPARYEMQMRWAESVKAKAQKQKAVAEQQDKPSFKPQLYTAQSNPKRIDGKAAELSELAGTSYVIRQQRAREGKARQEEKYNNLGKVVYHKSRPTPPPPDVLGSVTNSSRSRSNSPEARNSSSSAAVPPRQSRGGSEGKFNSSLVNVGSESSEIDLSRVQQAERGSGSGRVAIAPLNMNDVSASGTNDMTHNSSSSPRGSPKATSTSPTNGGNNSTPPNNGGRRPSGPGSSFTNAYLSNTFSDDEDMNRSGQQFNDQFYQQQFLFQHMLPPDMHLNEEESMFDMLERERRAWHLERVKLVHCIHMQQIELMQRSAAAQEQAVEIAKEFARTVDAFENRLLLVETNVQKEIMAIKSIADGLNTSISALNSGLGITAAASSNAPAATAQAAGGQKAPAAATAVIPRTPPPQANNPRATSPVPPTTNTATGQYLNASNETGGHALTARRLTSIEQGIETIISRLSSLEMHRPLPPPAPLAVSIPSPPQAANATGMSVYSQSTSAFTGTGGGGNLISRATIVPANTYPPVSNPSVAPPMASSTATISTVNSGSSNAALLGANNNPTSTSSSAPDTHRASGNATPGMHGAAGGLSSTSGSIRK